MLISALPTLYKKTTTGATQQWTVSVHRIGEGPHAEIVKVYGQVDGALQQARDVITKGKNSGKANETTPVSQALAEAKAMWDGKKKKGYVENISHAKEGKVDTNVITGGVAPMLAQKFADHAEKITYPAYIQRKYDGARCIATIVNGKATLWTRTRKVINSMPHIIAALEKVFNGKSITLDGELYNHTLHKDFEHLMHLVRPDKPAKGGEVVEYHVYDMISELPFSRRTMLLENSWKGSDKSLVLVDTFTIESAEEALEHTKRFQEEGYEGSIVRQAATKYEIGKRSYGLQKIKEFMDSEFAIIGVEEGRGRMAGCAIFVCKTKDGKAFNVKMEGSLDALKPYLRNFKLWKGKELTVRYQGLTKDGIPRFPIGKVVRDYE